MFYIIEFEKGREFARLKSLVSVSDMNKPTNQIPIKSIFKQLAINLKKTSQEWKIIIRLFQKSKQIYACILEIKDGEYELLQIVPKKYDLEFFIQIDAWWEMIKGNLSPMEALFKEKIRIGGININTTKFFRALIHPDDKNKIVFIDEEVR